MVDTITTINCIVMEQSVPIGQLPRVFCVRACISWEEVESIEECVEEALPEPMRDFANGSQVVRILRKGYSNNLFHTVLADYDDIVEEYTAWKRERECKMLYKFN